MSIRLKDPGTHSRCRAMRRRACLSRLHFKELFVVLLESGGDTHQDVAVPPPSHLSFDETELQPFLPRSLNHSDLPPPPPEDTRRPMSKPFPDERRADARRARDMDDAVFSLRRL